MENMDNQEQNQQEPVVKAKKNSKLKMFGLTILALAIIAVGWYFLYFTQTPEYSINAVRESIVKHDVSTFKKHVDLDSLLGRGYDDVIAAAIATDEKLAKDNFSKNLIEGLAKMFKGMVIAEGKDGILRYVETGKWEKDDAKKPPQQAQKSNTPSAKNVTEQTGLSDATFKGIAYSKQDGNIANVGAKVLLKDSNQEVIIDAKLRKLSDGTWQIVEISNLKDIIIQADKAKKAKQAAK